MNLVLGRAEKEQKEFKQLATELAKLDSKSVVKKSKREIEARVNQMLERSIISEEVIDVFDTLGIKRPEISILLEEFLEEVKAMKYKNLAVEMLKKLLEGSLKLMEKTNLVKSEKFSEKLNKALDKYRNQAINNTEVIEELIKMAQEIKQMKDKQKELGLNEDEIAFYDALTADNIVKEFMDDETLKKISHELTVSIRNNITIDWSIRKSAQAGMRKAELMCGNVDMDEIPYDIVAENTSNYTV